MAEVILKNIKKIYPHQEPKKKKKGEPEKKTNLQITEEGVLAVDNFNLHIQDKEFIVLVGPSGCGKSTTLRMVAGLEEISGGELYIGGQLMNDVAPKDRDISMVFQNYALYPHMSVCDNIAFPLEIRKVPKAKRRERAYELAQLLQISDYFERKPAQLSGGQQQRVANARALAKDAPASPGTRRPCFRAQRPHQLREALARRQPQRAARLDTPQASQAQQVKLRIQIPQRRQDWNRGVNRRDS